MTSTEHPTYLWHDHRLVPWEEATVHLTEPWWASVGAVFEGIRAYWNAEREEMYAFRLEDHLGRLENSMRLMRMPEEFGRDELRSAVLELIRLNSYREDVYIQPLAYTTGARSFSSLGDRSTHLFITTRPAASALDEDFARTAGFSSWTRISDTVVPPRVKALANYRNSQLASSEAAMHGYDTALILNTDGKVAEGPGACFAFVRDGVLVTPDLRSSILESITRDAVLRIAREQLELKVEERAVDRTETYLADEAFLCGTAAEVTPLSYIDGYELRHGAPGPVTRQIRDTFRAAVRGSDERYAHWRTAAGLSSTSDRTHASPGVQG